MRIRDELENLQGDTQIKTNSLVMKKKGKKKILLNLIQTIGYVQLSIAIKQL